MPLSAPDPVLAARKALGGPALGQGVPFVYDDFDRPDGTLQGMVCPTGQVWALSGTGYLTAAIAGRKVGSADNVYAYLDYGIAINRISGTFSLSPGPGTDNRGATCVVLIADNASIGLANMLHLLIRPNGWGLQKFVAGAPTLILDGNHELMNEVPYNVAFEISGSTVTVYPPQGPPASVTDADIGSTITPRYGGWQIGPDANGLVGKWWRVSMGPDQQGRLAAAAQAAPSAEIGWLRGSRLTLRRRISAVLSGGAGWYRISNKGNAYSYGIVGRVSLDARDQYRYIGALADVSSFWNGVPVLALERPSTIWAGAPIDQIRMSCDDTTYDVVLDVHVGNADPVTIEVEFEGYFDPVSEPVVGATALPTQSVVLNL